tara:strand:+ start:423 stop:527 length:105 start_codon:yes stop_codon:yes gene_type:complete
MGKLIVRLGNKIIAFEDMLKALWNKFLSKLMFKK